MSELERKQFVAIVKKITIRSIKHYRGRGPNYVNVNFIDDMVEICAKGILTNLGLMLIEHGEINFVKEMREKACAIVYKMIIRDLQEETGKHYTVCEDVLYFKDDIGVLRLIERDAL